MRISVDALIGGKPFGQDLEISDEEFLALSAEAIAVRYAAPVFAALQNLARANPT